MPKVYDWNGSAAAELKKIYDWNGIAAAQIKKGYDWNGTAGSLVYSAQSPSSSVILNGTDQVSSITGGWSVFAGGYAYQSGFTTYNGYPGIALSFSGNNSSGVGYGYTKNKIGINGWNYLNLDFYWHTGYGGAVHGPGYIYIGLLSSMTMSDAANPPWVVSSYVWKATDTNGTGTLRVSVSNINGSYYVVAYRKNGENKKTFTTVFRKVYFS